jgi:hypothetical protein
LKEQLAPLCDKKKFPPEFAPPSDAVRPTMVPLKRYVTVDFSGIKTVSLESESLSQF